MVVNFFLFLRNFFCQKLQPNVRNFTTPIFHNESKIFEMLIHFLPLRKFRQFLSCRRYFLQHSKTTKCVVVVATFFWGPCRADYKVRFLAGAAATKSRVRKMGDKIQWSMAIIDLADSVKLNFCPPSTKSLLCSTLIALYITSKSLSLSLSLSPPPSPSLPFSLSHFLSSSLAVHSPFTH
jgi:hypothetical protein